MGLSEVNTSLKLLAKQLEPNSSGNESRWGVNFSAERKIYTHLAALGLIPIGISQEEFFTMLAQLGSGKLADTGQRGISFEQFIYVKSLIDKVLAGGTVVKVPTDTMLIEALQRTGASEPNQEQKETLNRQWILAQIRGVLDKHVTKDSSQKHTSDLSATAEDLSNVITSLINTGTIPSTTTLKVLALNKASGLPLDQSAPSGTQTIESLKNILGKVVGLEKVCAWVRLATSRNGEGFGLIITIEFKQTAKPAIPQVEKQAPVLEPVSVEDETGIHREKISLSELTKLLRNQNNFNETYRNSGLSDQNESAIYNIDSFLAAWKDLKEKLKQYPELYVTGIKGGVLAERRVVDFLATLEAKDVSGLSILELLEMYDEKKGSSKRVLRERLINMIDKKEVSGFIKRAVKKMIEEK